MTEDQWYILAGVLIWSIVLLLAIVILLRALRQRIVQRRLVRLEEAEARRVANHFAAPAEPSSTGTSFDSTDDVRRLRQALQRHQPAWELFPPNAMYRERDGLSKEELNHLAPVTVHEEGKEASDVNQTTSDGMLVCVICLDDVAYGSRKRVLPCAHAFHARCVQIWLARSVRCPCCMTPVVKRPSSVPTAVPQFLHTIDFDDLNNESSRIRTPPQRVGGDRQIPRTRFLGLWTFGERETDGLQPPVPMNQPRIRLVDAIAGVDRPLPVATQTPLLPPQQTETITETTSEEPSNTVDIVDQVPSNEAVVQFVRPLERSRQIDDMVSTAA